MKQPGSGGDGLGPGGRARRRLLTALVVAPASAMLSPTGMAAETPAGEKVRRLLILDSQIGNPYDEIRTAVLAGLDRRGYREGKNLDVRLVVAGNDVDAGEEQLAAALAEEDADVILTGGTVATMAAKNLLYRSPRHRVVFAAPTDPVGIGVIDGFDRPPPANFTGVSYPVPVKARLKFIRKLMPQARTFALIHADMPQSHSYNRWLRELLASDPDFAGIDILFRSVPLVTGERGDERMAEMAIPAIQELDPLVDAFIKPNDQLGTRRHFAEVVDAHASRPLIGITRDDVMAGWGSTAVVYPDHGSIGDQAAAMIALLFEGRSLSSIQPEWPRRFGFAVDLPRARRHGLAVPVEILQLSGENVVR